MIRPASRRSTYNTKKKGASFHFLPQYGQPHGPGCHGELFKCGVLSQSTWEAAAATTDGPGFTDLRSHITSLTQHQPAARAHLPYGDQLWMPVGGVYVYPRSFT